MISGIKRQPRPGPLRMVKEHLPDEDLLECAHRLPVSTRRRSAKTRIRNLHRRCHHCHGDQRAIASASDRERERRRRRRELQLEADARAAA